MFRLNVIKGREEALFLLAVLIGSIWAFLLTFGFRSVPYDVLGLAFWPRLLLVMLDVAVVSRMAVVWNSVGERTERFAPGVLVWLLGVGFAMVLIVFGTIAAILAYMMAMTFMVKRSFVVRQMLISIGIAAFLALASLLLFEGVLGVNLPHGVWF